MTPKLRSRSDDRTAPKLALSDLTLTRGPGFQPHIAYANLALDPEHKSRETKRLIGWCQEEGPDWSNERILDYLVQHHSAFRECLTWVLTDACVDFEDWRKELAKDSQYVFSDDLLREWEKTPEVKFLQLHGILHSKVSVRPRISSETDMWCFWGLDIGPRKPRDPVDIICWHVLYLLARDGVISGRECKGCERFFTPLTRRKRYCSDLCRAKAHAKTPAQWRQYMRKYRAIKKHLRELREAKKTVLT